MKTSSKVSKHRNQSEMQAEKLIRDIELYQRIFHDQSQKPQKSGQAMQIRRLVPNRLQQSQLFNNPQLQCFNTQLDQETSYSLHMHQVAEQLMQERRRRKISVSMIDCSKLFKSTNYVPQKSLMHKIIVINHQGRPQTYYLK